jgi:hypothetical protein
MKSMVSSRAAGGAARTPFRTVLTINLRLGEAPVPRAAIRQAPLACLCTETELTRQGRKHGFGRIDFRYGSSSRRVTIAPPGMTAPGCPGSAGFPEKQAVLAQPAPRRRLRANFE